MFFFKIFIWSFFGRVYIFGFRFNILIIFCRGLFRSRKRLLDGWLRYVVILWDIKSWIGFFFIIWYVISLGKYCGNI